MPNDEPQPQGNYVPAVVAAAETVNAPGVHHIFIEHDDWCAFLNGCGPCNCNPRVSAPVKDGPGGEG
jgi:hypothetical protein